MGKFIVRVSIVLTAIYFVISSLFAQLLGVDILAPYYILLFELCVVIYAFSEGKYHCKYIKYTALALLLSDTLTQLDNALDFLTIEAHNLIPVVLITIGIFMGVFLAIKHYIRVIKLKNSINERNI
jgi:hypothetical protein